MLLFGDVANENAEEKKKEKFMRWCRARGFDGSKIPVTT